MNKTMYKYNLIKNQIIFDKPVRKGKNVIKVYFNRNVDEREQSDYPLAYTSSERNQKIFDWIDGFEIIDIIINQKRFFGLIDCWVQVIKDETISKTNTGS